MRAKLSGLCACLFVHVFVLQFTLYVCMYAHTHTQSLPILIIMVKITFMIIILKKCNYNNGDKSVRGGGKRRKRWERRERGGEEG